MKQWALYIDIQGFSYMYRTGQKVGALELLSGLMYDLYKTGTRIYPDDSKRLFIYQLGDGFIVCPDFVSNLVESISIAIALMQSTALRGGFTRAAISHGEMSDILGCYPKEIQDNVSDASVLLNSGIMVIFPVMGDALINTYVLSKSKPKGPRLLLDKKFELQVKDINISIIAQYPDHIEIDWIHSETPILGDILKKIDCEVPSSKKLEEIVKDYIKNNKGLPTEWKKSARNLIQRKKELLTEFPRFATTNFKS